MRMVVKGFQQQKNIDFTEIFSHVVKLTIRSILSIVATEYLHLEQLNVKTMSLLGDFEDTYMMQQQGYIMLGKSS